MESQMMLDGFRSDSPVGAGETLATKTTDDATAQQEGAGQNPARFAVDALQSGREKDALCAVACDNTGRPAGRKRPAEGAPLFHPSPKPGAYSEMPDNWCEFAGLEPASFPRVPEPAFPPAESRFTAFHLTSPQNCRVVIVGQDPYHGVGQAQGLAFSVPPAVRAPPSLKNILKELAGDLETPELRSHDLTDWASNGVLLLNAILSVAPGLPASHRQLGWQTLTSRIIQALGNDAAPRVFMLWGNEAMNFRSLIDERKNLVLASSHPSPMGNACRRPSGKAPAFFGTRPFSRANQWLIAQGRAPVAWI